MRGTRVRPVKIARNIIARNCIELSQDGAAATTDTASDAAMPPIDPEFPMKTLLIATVATLGLVAPALAQSPSAEGTGTLNVWGARLDAPTVLIVPQRAPDVASTGSVAAPRTVTTPRGSRFDRP